MTSEFNWQVEAAAANLGLVLMTERNKQLVALGNAMFDAIMLEHDGYGRDCAACRAAKAWRNRTDEP